MKGVGYYDDRSFYPSSSNLSAFAQPFSVNRSTSNDVSAPYMDLAESTDAIPSNPFPVPSRSYGYDFFANPVRELDSTPSSKAYGYSGSQVLDPPTGQLPHFNTLGLASKDTFAYDHCSNSIKSSLVEAQSYYPSYISPTIHDDNPSVAPNYWSPSSGFATLDESKKSSEIGCSGQRAGLYNQFAEFNQGKCKQMEVGASFCSKETNLTGSNVGENLMNQGFQDVNVKGSDNGEVLHSTNMMGWEQHCVSISADQLDDKSCWWQTAKSMPIGFSSTSIQGSPSVSRETCYEAPLKLVADSGNHHLSYTASNDKYLRQHDKPSLVDIGSSALITGSVKDFSVGNITAVGDIGSNNIANMKVAYPLPNSGSTGCFDLGQLRLHLERNEPSNNAMLSDKSGSSDVVDYIFKERLGFQNPHANLDNLSLGFSTNEGVNSFEKSFDSVNRCNPAVDSPCWKGAPATHFSPFEDSEALHPEYVNSNEVYFGSNSQVSRTFLLDANNNGKISYENSKNNQIHDDIDYQERGLAGSMGKFSLANFASEENDLDGAVNTACFQSKPIYDCGLQYLDDISEMRENSMASNKSTYDCDSRSSNTEQQVIEENKPMSQKQCTLCGGCADVKNNVNNCLKYSASHAAEPSLSSPSPVVDAPTALKKSAEEVSTTKINVQMLVDTMHNLSELLLFHCLNDACELKGQDLNVLGNVISNLNTCALKKAEQMIPAKECLFPQLDPSKCARESHELQQNARFERPLLTKVDPEGSKVELENPPVQEVENHHFVSGKQGKISEFFPTKGSETMKEDNMTKALKRILSENFHDEEGAESQTLLYKNLWLEAEAAICSINYRARYRQMKIEMEKYSYKQRDNNLDVEEQSKLEVASNLSATQSPATKVNSLPNDNYSAANFPVLNAANLKELSGLKFSPDLNKPSTLTPEDKGGQNLGSFIQDSAVSGTNQETGDLEASSMSKFHALSSRVEKSCVNTANPEKLPSSEASHALDKADKLASGQTDSENQVNFTQVSPIPGNSKADDFERSVMARFHILKSRVEDSSSMCSEEQLLDGVGYVGNGTDCTIIRNASEGDSLDVNINPAMTQLNSYTAVDKSILQEFHLNLEDDQEIQPRGSYSYGSYRYGIQRPMHNFEAIPRPTYNFDGFSSSDWEHVKMEELAGQSSKP